MDFMDLSKYNILLEQSYEKRLGKVAKVVGLTVESIGHQRYESGDQCRSGRIS